MRKLNNENSSFLAKIRCFVFDVDGVMTDGSLVYSKGGEELKVFNVRDGLGIKLLMREAEVVVLSGNPSQITKTRCLDLGIKHIFIGIEEKESVLVDLQNRLNIAKNETLFVGDDINDASLREHVGYFLAPMDADPSILKISDFVIPVRGGKGAIRYLVNCYFHHVEKTQYKPGMW